tara:strand:+ start:210 stop:521 length:312 start_codon:yes stop_codon:yes gene_type:complete
MEDKIIKINTLTEEEIDKIKINEINLSSRIQNHLVYKDIKTLLDLKNFVKNKGINSLYEIGGFGNISLTTITELLNHAYPNLQISQLKYTFKDLVSNGGVNER